MKGLSKFEFSSFFDEWGDLSYFGASRQRYSLEDAAKICESEMDWQEGDFIVAQWWTRHRVGQSFDGEPCAGWFIDDHDDGRSCPIWLFEYGAMDKRNVRDGFMTLDEMRAGEQA